MPRRRPTWAGDAVEEDTCARLPGLPSHLPPARTATWPLQLPRATSPMDRAGWRWDQRPAALGE
eukprot:5102164-Lingulodinium_polyedra.AAC.1